LMLEYGTIFIICLELIFAAREVLAKYERRLAPKAPAERSDPPPAKPPRNIEKGKKVDRTKVSPTLARWIWWASHRENGKQSPSEIYTMLTTCRPYPPTERQSRGRGNLLET
jgi:hypothetical protein